MTVEVAKLPDGWVVLCWTTPDRGRWLPAKDQAEAEAMARQMLNPN